MRVMTANLDKERDGDRRYLQYLRRRLRRGILCQQERGRGLHSTRVVGVGWKITRKWGRALGAVGAHRGVAVAAVRIPPRRGRGRRRRVLVISIHGLHVRTVGRATQDRFYELLAAWLRRLDRRGVLWVLAGDFNRRHEAVAELVGGVSVGEGVDGVVVSAGLVVELVAVDRWGLEQGLTDHPAVLADVQLAA